MTRDRLLRRLTIFGAIIGAFVLVDGLVIFFTGGLTTDATPVLPVLGGSFAKTRSSGVSVIILGVVLVALTLLGRWRLGRRLAGEGAETGAAADRPSAHAGDAGAGQATEVHPLAGKDGARPVLDLAGPGAPFAEPSDTPDILR